MTMRYNGGGWFGAEKKMCMQKEVRCTKLQCTVQYMAAAQFQAVAQLVNVQWGLQ